MKVGVTTTCFLLTDPLHLNICCQCVYFDGAESTLLFFTSSAGRHRVRYQPVCCTAGTPRCAALREGISSVVSWSYSLAMYCSICRIYFFYLPSNRTQCIQSRQLSTDMYSLHFFMMYMYIDTASTHCIFDIFVDI